MYALLFMLGCVIVAGGQPAVGAAEGTVAYLWKWWPESGRTAPSRSSQALECLGDKFSSGRRDKAVYSQAGEDGIIETIFDCIGTKDKYYVEFGTQDCSECTTRYLRTKGWSGLLMDGSNENPSINLRKEYMRADNIADLFKKYDVPFPTFDHLTTDIDQNTFWVLHAILEAGYRPRSVTTEFNKNFAPTQAYATLNLPDEQAGGPGIGWNCYFGASALAYERMMRAFGYTLMAFDERGINLFFVLDTELGGPMSPEQHSYSLMKANYNNPGLAGRHWFRHMRPVLLKHTPGPHGTRIFTEMKTSAVITVHRKRADSLLP